MASIVVQLSFLSKQWQGVASSFRVLDLDENDNIERQKAHQNLNLHIENQDQHYKFINFLNGYLEYRETYDRKVVLDKLRLHLRTFLVPDLTTITNWLNYAFERGVKHLDINLDKSSSGCRRPREIFNSNCYCLPWVTFANAKCLTRLNLECMRITDIQREYIQIYDHHQRLLPSLETMTFASVWFDDEALSSLVNECPSLKHLSTTGCWFSDWKFHVSSSTLKFLEIKDCEIQVLRVDEAKNLDTFTFFAPSIGIGSSFFCQKMKLNKCFNLKRINIRVDKLLKLSILGCLNALEATIETEHLQHFDFFNGYLNAKVSVNAIEARILVEELFDKEWSSSNSTHCPKLMTFLKGFTSCREICLYNQDVRALIVPKNYRKMTSILPLPKCSILKVRMPNTPIKGSRDYLELMDSLRWIAPSTCISIDRANQRCMQYDWICES